MHWIRLFCCCTVCNMWSVSERMEEDCCLQCFKRLCGVQLKQLEWYLIFNKKKKKSTGHSWMCAGNSSLQSVLVNDCDLIALVGRQQFCINTVQATMAARANQTPWWSKGANLTCAYFSSIKWSNKTAAYVVNKGRSRNNWVVQTQELILYSASEKKICLHCIQWSSQT